MHASFFCYTHPPTPNTKEQKNNSFFVLSYKYKLNTSIESLKKAPRRCTNRTDLEAAEWSERSERNEKPLVKADIYLTSLTSC